MRTLLILFILLPLFTLATERSHVETHIEKSNEGIWSVKYDVNRPIKRLAFIRNPDKSRIERWQPIHSAFEIIFQDNKEVIVKIR